MENKPIKILIIDDEADFRRTMEFWFKSKGYIVNTTGDIELALQMIKENLASIIFLDLVMPQVDGVELLKKIREISPDVPVIIISAYVGDKEKIKKLDALGIDGVFYKGADFQEGLNLLEVALRKHRKIEK